MFVHSLFFELREKSAAFLQYFGKKVVVEGRITNDPASNGKNIQLVVRPNGKKEQVLVNMSKFAKFQYGTRIRLTGKIQEAPVFNDFNYRDYLATKHIFAVMWYPAVEVLEKGSYGNAGSFIFSKILNFKHVLQGVIQQNLQGSYAAILNAFVLGDQNQMGDDLKQQLNVTGLRHIVAISGQHIVILTGMIEAFLLAIGCWKKQAIVISICVMIFFIVLTGAEASAVRSGIMGGFFFFGQYLGRTRAALRGLVFACALMLFLNPLLLFHDVGFQLSFLAVLGMIVSLKFFQHCFRKVPSVLGVRDMIATNFSAQLFTFPILIYNFGYISIIGILANVLILPIASLLLGLGFLFLLAGAVWGFLGSLLSWPVFFVLFYFHFVVAFFAKLPFASLTIENLSPLWLVAAYIPIVYMLWKFKKTETQGF